MSDAGQSSSPARGAVARLRGKPVGWTAGAFLLAALAVAAIVAFAQGRGSPHRPVARGAHQLPRAAPRVPARSSIPELAVVDIRRLAALGMPIYCGGPKGNEVAFTFDDGPGPYTYLALRKLTQAHERATFFVVGRSMINFPGYLPRELKLAAIGDHTYSHPDLPEFAPSFIHTQIATTKQMIEQQTGQPVYLFRPPYGARDAVVDGFVKQLGLLDILWSVDSQDSLGANWAGIIRNVEAGMRPGAIILMHENRGQTIRALTTLLPELQRRHLRSVSVPELLATDPPSMAQVHAGWSACGASAPLSSGS